MLFLKIRLQYAPNRGMAVTTLPFSALSDPEISGLLSKYKIGLTIDEARKVEEMLKRPPTIVEAVIWGIQGSEHCSYKSSRRFLKQFPTDGKNVILGPKEDSGIIAITDGPEGKRWGLVVSHESHNKPSQVVPYEGAATGIGGCVRDVLCMGARVIGCMDSLRLGDLKTDETRSIAKEVIRGIAGYANPLGIPNLGGDTYFDAANNRQCLVNAISIGLIREDEIIHSYVPDEAGKVGYDIILVGKPTDRSGFGGASFASQTLSYKKESQNTGAVQEPNPFLERHLLASTYDLFDWLAKEKQLGRISFKDLGAGGVVCASVEQVAPKKMGAIVDLEKVHVSLPDLPAEVIACAETQERFCWICHPDLTQRILKHYNESWDLPSIAEGARASLIGKVTEDEAFILTYKGETVCSASSTDITSGLQYTREIEEWKNEIDEPIIEQKDESITVNGKTFTIEKIFTEMLRHPSYANKDPVFRSYDKNVIGNTFLEPGESDAGVLLPLQDVQSYVHSGTHEGWDVSAKEQFTGVAMASGGNGRYGRISPYLQGLNATVETIRNIAAVGAVPIALTDCLNYANPEVSKELWSLAEGVRGISDAARGIDIDSEPVPIISGNVSLYNGGIDPTAIVAAFGKMNDGRKAITIQLKKSDSSLYLIGERKDELGGSAYYQILEELLKAKRDALLGSDVPSPDLKSVKNEILLMQELISKGLLLASHDISEGGLLLGLFEMTAPQRKVGGNIGVSIDLDTLHSTLRADTLLFSETGGFIVEVSASSEKEFLNIAQSKQITPIKIGKTTAAPIMNIDHQKKTLFKADLLKLRIIWDTALSTAWQ